MSVTEDRLAEQARYLAAQFNFNTMKPKDQSQLEEAKELYRTIFYDKTFVVDKAKNMQLYFDNNLFIKVTSCNKCAKRVYEKLLEFSKWVLDE